MIITLLVMSSIWGFRITTAVSEVQDTCTIEICITCKRGITTRRERREKPPLCVHKTPIWKLNNTILHLLGRGAGIFCFGSIIFFTVPHHVVSVLHDMLIFDIRCERVCVFIITHLTPISSSRGSIYALSAWCVSSLSWLASGLFLHIHLRILITYSCIGILLVVIALREDERLTLVLKTVKNVIMHRFIRIVLSFTAMCCFVVIGSMSMFYFYTPRSSGVGWYASDQSSNEKIEINCADVELFISGFKSSFGDIYCQLRDGIRNNRYSQSRELFLQIQSSGETEEIKLIKIYLTRIYFNTFSESNSAMPIEFSQPIPILAKTCPNTIQSKFLLQYVIMLTKTGLSKGHELVSNNIISSDIMTEEVMHHVRYLQLQSGFFIARPLSCWEYVYKPGLLLDLTSEIKIPNVDHDDNDCYKLLQGLRGSNCGIDIPNGSPYNHILNTPCMNLKQECSSLIQNITIKDPQPPNGFPVKALCGFRLLHCGSSYANLTWNLLTELTLEYPGIPTFMIGAGVASLAIGRKGEADLWYSRAHLQVRNGNDYSAVETLRRILPK